MNTQPRKIGLSMRETAWLLSMSEAQVRRRLANGTLTYAAPPSRVDIASVRSLFPADALRNVRERVLQRLLADEIEATKPESRHARQSIHFLIAATLQASLPHERRAALQAMKRRRSQ